MKKGLIILLIFLPASLTFGQSQNKRCSRVPLNSEAFFLDSLSIFNESIHFPGYADSLFSFYYDINKGLIKLESDLPLDSVKICYQVFPFSFHKRYYRRDLQVYDSNAFFKEQPIMPDLIGNREELFSSPGLNKSGSISRGVSLGNNQNVFVNSSLNLQMEGKLTEDVNIRASISDQNVPFQPEGNTQHLQEFDNVYVELYNDHGALTVGDVVFRNPDNHFLKYYRNVQGGRLNLNDPVEDQKRHTYAGIALAKGKFGSDQIDVNEGVLGPYQIRGPANERFIIILANSEKVYLDGKLLRRGFNFDYVIDYNLAEITFTNNVLITKFSRLRIDFEYSDRNYSRTILNAGHQQEIGNFDFFVHAYSELDNRNQPLTFDLSDEEKLQFSDAGDNVPLTIMDPGDSVVFNENVILYKKIDTVVNNGPVMTIFKFSTHPDSARFNVSFADVGTGAGDYVQLRSTANGRVYAWIAPVNGQSQGRFAPVKVIPAPTKKQLISFGAAYKVKKVGRFFSELAFSDQDINLFSEKDRNDDHGWAMKMGYDNATEPWKAFGGYKWQSSISFEYNERNFQGIDRFRYIEFDRDWSYNPTSDDQAHNDNIFDFTTTFQKDPENILQYQLTKRKRGRLVDGSQHRWMLMKSIGHLNVHSNFFSMENEQTEILSTWERFNVDVFWKSTAIIPGYQYSIDRNENRSINNDSLISTAMNFREHKFYLKSSDSLRSGFFADFSIREDNLPVDGELVKSNYAETTNMGFNGKIGDNQRVNATFTYRKIDNYVLTEAEPATEETIMGRLDWQGSLFDRILNTNLTYAIGNGRELKKTFVFLPVPTGEGTHTWRDENQDGVQDLNEFFEAINTDERNFIKLLQPTNEFIQAHTNNLVFRMDFKFPAEWSRHSFLKKLLYRFSNNTSINLLQKFTSSDLSTRLFSFAQHIENDQLIAARSALRSTLFFNGANPKYGFDIGVFNTRRKQLFSNGFEDVSDRNLSLNVRWNLNRIWDFRVQMRKSEKSNESDFLSERNFIILEQAISPVVAWQPGNKFRVSVGYLHAFRENQLMLENEENASVNEFSIDFRSSKVNNRNLSINFKMIDIAFQGRENNAAGYELLKALRPGTNFTWMASLQQKIAGGLQLSVIYEGRKSEEHAVVNIGRIQVRALF